MVCKGQGYSGVASVPPVTRAQVGFFACARFARMCLCHNCLGPLACGAAAYRIHCSHVHQQGPSVLEVVVVLCNCPASVVSLWTFPSRLTECGGHLLTGAL